MAGLFATGSETLGRVAQHERGVVPGASRAQRAALDAAEIEEVADDPVEALGLLFDRAREVLALSRRSR